MPWASTRTVQDTVAVQKGHAAQVGAFGANGTVPQLAVQSLAAVVHAAGANPTQAEYNTLVDAHNNIRTALIACGILK